MNQTEWKEVVGLDPLQIEQIRAAGYAYLKQGQYDTALCFFKALVTLEPESVYDLQTLGALFLEIGEYREALETLEHALNLDRSHAKTAYNRASTLLLLGYKKPAHVELLRLSSIDDPVIASKSQALLLAHFPKSS